MYHFSTPHNDCEYYSKRNSFKTVEAKKRKKQKQEKEIKKAEQNQVYFSLLRETNKIKTFDYTVKQHIEEMKIYMSTIVKMYEK